MNARTFDNIPLGYAEKDRGRNVRILFEHYIIDIFLSTNTDIVI